VIKISAFFSIQVVFVSQRVLRTQLTLVSHFCHLFVVVTHLVVFFITIRTELGRLGWNTFLYIVAVLALEEFGQFGDLGQHAECKVFGKFRLSRQHLRELLT
jgi:hypothetical protein